MDWAPRCFWNGGHKFTQRKRIRITHFLYNKRERFPKCRMGWFSCVRMHPMPSWTSGTLSLCVMILSLVLLCSRSVVSTDSYKQLEEKAVMYLGKFGYLSGPSQEAENLMSHDDFKNAIKRLQRMGHILETGVVDAKTIQLMERPRCGVSDNMNAGLAPTKWNKTELTYNILNYTPDLSERTIRDTFSYAFIVWSDVTNFTFMEVQTRKADIVLKFASRYHSDGYPFDGNGIILAHAVPPWQDNGWDIHFDDDEHWTGIDLLTVALHEIGHALGLRHSAVPGSLMYPWYRRYQPNFKLVPSDVEGIQKLYGSEREDTFPDVDHKFTPRPPIVTQRPDDRSPYTVIPPTSDDIPDPCDHAVDAITLIRSELFIFIKKWFWRVDSGGILGHAIELQSFWYGFPDEIDGIDAVFERPDGRIIFFIGDRYWIFNGNSVVADHPKEGRPITDFGLPMDLETIDAVFVWGYDQRTYIISQDIYWKLIETNDYIENNYPRDMGIWENVLLPVSSAFTYLNDTTYFIQGDQYSEFYVDTMRVPKGYPKDFGDHWLKCNEKDNQYTMRPERGDTFPDVDHKFTPRPPIVTQRPDEGSPHTVLPPTPDDISDPCDHAVDAISIIRSELFIFIKKWFWRVDSGCILGNAIELQSFWYGFPDEIDGIDAVFERPDGRIIFFIGDRYWIFNGNRVVADHPMEGRPITDFGLPVDLEKIDAVFVWGYNQRTYIISNDIYWKLIETNDYIENNYPRDMGIWENVLLPVSSAFTYLNDTTYFIQGDQYSEFYVDTMRVPKGYPKDFGDHWLKCKEKANEYTMNFILLSPPRPNDEEDCTGSDKENQMIDDEDELLVIASRNTRRISNIWMSQENMPQRSAGINIGPPSLPDMIQDHLIVITKDIRHTQF